MSDPVTNLEIEDVLSSIRRLVSEDARRAERPRADGASGDRLVLTPSLRVKDLDPDLMDHVEDAVLLDPEEKTADPEWPRDAGTEAESDTVPIADPAPEPTEDAEIALDVAEVTPDETDHPQSARTADQDAAHNDEGLSEFRQSDRDGVFAPIDDSVASAAPETVAFTHDPVGAGHISESFAGYDDPAPASDNVDLPEAEDVSRDPDNSESELTSDSVPSPHEDWADTASQAGDVVAPSSQEDEGSRAATEPDVDLAEMPEHLAETDKVHEAEQSQAEVDAEEDAIRAADTIAAEEPAAEEFSAEVGDDPVTEPAQWPSDAEVAAFFDRTEDTPSFDTTDDADPAPQAATAEQPDTEFTAAGDISAAADSLTAKIETLEAAIQQTNDGWDPAAAGFGDNAARPTAALQWEDAEPEPADMAELLEPEADPVTAGEDAVLDEAALRDLVADIVRQELQGVLGERITRNVRKLVRREIHRALNSRDFD